MKYILILFLHSPILFSQTVEGFWKTVDEDGIAKSIVKIYKNENNELEGKVYKILKESERDMLCSECKGDKKNKPIEGLIIIEEMKYDGDKWSKGTITDPENGKSYDGKIWLDEDNSNILHVRGYVSFFYRTQDWIRAQNSLK